MLSGAGPISALKTVPVIGQIAGTILLPALALASTVAVGRVFLQHFEAGGTLLDFDPEKMKSYFEAEFNKARAGSAAEMAAGEQGGLRGPTPKAFAFVRTRRPLIKSFLCMDKP